LASVEPDLSLGMNGDHAEIFTPTRRENVTLGHATKAVNDEQGRAFLHRIDGIGKTDGKHVVAMCSPQFDRDAPKDARVAFEALANDFFAHHVPHGPNRQGQRGRHVRKFPLAAGGQAADGQNADHDPP
jgi:hypothetical protein